MDNIEQIIKGCKKYKTSAQNALYERFAPMLFSICKRYIRDMDEAGDILQDAFMKIYQKINQFSGKGSFEGWLKKIVVNTAINHIKKKKSFVNIADIDELHNKELLSNGNSSLPFNEKEIDIKDVDTKTISIDLIKNANISLNEMQEAINRMPEQYGVVFNLYYIEDYKHQEIAEKLNITVKNSWIRLLRAKEIFKEELYKLSIEKLAR